MRKKTIVFEINPTKETPGCYRYMRTGGDEGVETLYLRKESLEGAAPTQITMTLTGE